MKHKVVVLGAGFGGLELTTLLSESMPDQLDLTLIDKSDSFIFGFSKLDVMFGRKSPDSVRLHYRNMTKPGVQFRQETITAIDPASRRVTTHRQTYDADILVIALGADYDFTATPGLNEGKNEFYTLAGATHLQSIIPTFSKGHAIIGVTSAPFKCPPAPSEAALMLHDYLTERRVRGDCRITLVMPFGLPIPPAPDASQALLAAFAERDITFVPKHTIRAVDASRRVAVLDDNTELPCDLFLGIPKHRVPDVIAATDLTEKNWIPVNPENLMTRYPGVYAVGDVTSVGTAKAGVFAEGAARVAAASIIAELQHSQKPAPYTGEGVCYIEFGAGRVAQVSVNFLSGPKPVGTYMGASTELVADKHHFGSTRQARWFGTPS